MGREIHTGDAVLFGESVVDIEGDKLRDGSYVGWNATGRDVRKSKQWTTPPMSKTGRSL